MYFNYIQQGLLYIYAIYRIVNTMINLSKGNAMNKQKKLAVKNTIRKYAFEVGFDDIRFVEYESAHYILLFKPFDPGKSNHNKHNVAASIYYAVSNFTDDAVTKLKQYIQNELEINAKVASDDVYVKSVAIASGGIMGLNSLYYHPDYGSIVSMQALRVFTDLSDKKPVSTSKCCMCLKCISACPTGAISKEGFDRTKCVREYMDYEVPEEHRDKAYQLFSCEKCQLCCPENKAKQIAEPKLFDIQSILMEKQTNAITNFCGSYVGTRDRIIREAILIAAKNNLDTVIPQLQILQNDEDARISKYAKWALAQIK